MWALGKTAALAASARNGFAQHERAKLLGERIALARDVHDRVIQRLFGISLVLGSGETLDAGSQARTADELRGAIEELRSVLQRTSEPPRPPASADLAAEAERLRRYYPDADFTLAIAAEPPGELQALAQSVLAEALHNAGKHARARAVEISARRDGQAFTLEVRNDGVEADAPPGGGGMGLKLAALDAIEHGGVLEFGPVAGEGWRVRLVLPGADGAGA
jgi:signal transduction histidine kinase